MSIRNWAFPRALRAGIIFLTLFSGSLPPSLLQAQEAYPLLPNRPVRNIILFIGDGMGLGQITAGRIHSTGGVGKLNIEKMPVVGLLHTQSVDNLITDSAAGATALACGVKTANGMVGVLPDGSAVESILEAVRDRGGSTGLVATSSITHATPACFGAHIDSRSRHAEIAEQLIAAGINVLLGAGTAYFLPGSTPESKRADETDLLAIAKEVGYEIVKDREALLNASADRLLGLFAAEALSHQEGEPSLGEMTAKALEILPRDDDGFFLMVEGSQIDWGGHDNNPDYVIREMLEFDRAVKTGLEFALRDSSTLVVVTADHETGGMALNGGKFDGSALEIGWTTEHHTGIPVPLFAFGPHCLSFTGVRENSEVPRIFAGLLNISPFPRPYKERRTAATPPAVKNNTQHN